MPPSARNIRIGNASVKTRGAAEILSRQYHSNAIDDEILQHVIEDLKSVIDEIEAVRQELKK